MDKTKLTYSFISAADLSAKEGYAVKLNGLLTNNQPQVVLATENSVNIGIVYDGGRQSGDEVTTVISGICEAKLGGDVTVGNLLKSDENGALVASANTTDDQIIAQALGTGASGEFIKVLIKPMSV